MHVSVNSKVMDSSQMAQWKFYTVPFYTKENKPVLSFVFALIEYIFSIIKYKLFKTKGVNLLWFNCLSLSTLCKIKDGQKF